MQRVLVVIAGMLAGMPGALASSPMDEPVPNLLDSGESCVPPARLTTPSDVELGDAGDEEGVAPADLPGSDLDVDQPNDIAFPFFVDPLPPGGGDSSSQPGLTARDRAGASLYLGDVHYDRASGSVTLGGAEIAAPAKPCP